MKNNKQPYFIGIGGQRCGTTWLYSHLKKHPEIWMPPVKELHYFSRDDKYLSPSAISIPGFFQRISKSRYEPDRTKRGMYFLFRALRNRKWSTVKWYMLYYFGYYDDKWYSKLFPKNGLKTGEITPNYSMLEADDIEKLYQINPDVKLILMIRNPVDRAWSGLRFTTEKLSQKIHEGDRLFEQISDKQHLEGGEFFKTIKNYLKVFPSNQLLIIHYEAIKEHPKDVLHSLCDFLDIGEFNSEFVDLSKKVNSAQKKNMPEEILSFLENYYKNEVVNLQKLLGGYTLNWTDPVQNDETKHATQIVDSEKLESI